MTEMEYKPLEEILTKSQIKALIDKIQELRKKGISPSEPEYVDALKELFNQWKDELEKRGVYPDYLAYIITFWALSFKPSDLMEILNAKYQIAKKKLDDVI